MSRRLCCILLLVVLLTAADLEAAKKKRKKKVASEDPYAELVWPPPPNEPRIKLDAVLTGRADVEAGSRLRRILIGASPQSPYDTLRKPFAVEFDSRGRILVTDWGNAATVRFDRREGRFDVLGTRTNPALKQPLGLEVGSDDSIYVTDIGLRQVLKLSPTGGLLAVYGRPGELANPTDAAVSPDGKTLYVADSKEHRIVVFDEGSAEIRSSFGRRGSGDGDLFFPTSLEFDLDGNLLVVDQMNARVQLFAPDGEYLDQFGGRGVGFGSFSRPKDVAVDGAGFIYVTDNAFNNVQLFDADFTLLSFIGETGAVPGRFWGASGVAARGDEFAVVDQIGARVQVFRYLAARSLPPPGQPAARTVASPVEPPRPAVERPAPAAGREASAPVPEEIAAAQPPVAAEGPSAAEVGPTEVVEPLPADPPSGESARSSGAEPTPPATVPPPAAAASPPAAAASPAPARGPDAAPVVPEEAIARFVDEWRSAWAGQRPAEYLASYAREFRPATGLSREAWETQRRERLIRPLFIEIEIGDLRVELFGPEEATARFVQTYRSNTFSDRVRKTLELVREGGAWRIVRETVDEEL